MTLNPLGAWALIISGAAFMATALMAPTGPAIRVARAAARFGRRWLAALGPILPATIAEPVTGTAHTGPGHTDHDGQPAGKDGSRRESGSQVGSREPVPPVAIAEPEPPLAQFELDAIAQIAAAIAMHPQGGTITANGRRVADTLRGFDVPDLTLARVLLCLCGYARIGGVGWAMEAAVCELTQLDREEIPR